MLEHWYQTEISRLEIYHSVCIKAVEQFANNQIYQLTDLERNRIVDILDRVFINELDFLQKHLKEYYKLYR